METLAVEISSGRLKHIVVLSKPTCLPLRTGPATAAVVLGLLFKL